MRYVLLDRITELKPLELAKGIKCVTLSEDFFVDHFPGHPVFPGALLLESMALLGGVLCEASIQARGRSDLHAILAKANEVKFKKRILPGDQIRLEAKLKNVSDDGARVSVCAVVGTESASEAELTFVFYKSSNPKSQAHRQALWNLWLKGEAEPL